MKRLILLLALSISILSCQKDKSLLVKDVPDWLKNQISGLEQQIKNDPGSIVAYTAWVRYQWGNEYYFEYINPPSSLYTGPVRMDGQNFGLGNPELPKYETGKCCMEYVWKGPKY